MKTFEELDQKLALVIEKRWNGTGLPFPILLDSTWTTIKAYGISSYPTTLLLDPEGRVVKGNGEENLKRKLEELAAADQAPK